MEKWIEKIQNRIGNPCVNFSHTEVKCLIEEIQHLESDKTHLEVVIDVLKERLEAAEKMYAETNRFIDRLYGGRDPVLATAYETGKVIEALAEWEKLTQNASNFRPERKTHGNHQN